MSNGFVGDGAETPLPSQAEVGQVIIFAVVKATLARPIDKVVYAYRDFYLTFHVANCLSACYWNPEAIDKKKKSTACKPKTIYDILAI